MNYIRTMPGDRVSAVAEYKGLISTKELVIRNGSTGTVVISRIGYCLVWWDDPVWSFPAQIKIQELNRVIQTQSFSWVNTHHENDYAYNIVVVSDFLERAINKIQKLDVKYIDLLKSF